jgi:hypothetical protein
VVGTAGQASLRDAGRFLTGINGINRIREAVVNIFFGCNCLKENGLDVLLFQEVKKFIAVVGFGGILKGAGNSLLVKDGAKPIGFGFLGSSFESGRRKKGEIPSHQTWRCDVLLCPALAGR